MHQRPGAPRGHRVDRRDQDHSSSSSDSYSEEPRTPRNHDNIGISSGDENYADDCVDEYVDDCEEPFTPRAYSGRRMNPRHDNYEHEDGLRDGHRRNWGRSDDQQAYNDTSDERQVFWRPRWTATGE